MPRDVYVLAAISFCVAVGFGVLVPVLPVFAQSFGVGNFASGAVVSAFAVFRLVTSPWVGRMIDWAGERAILATGIGIVAISSALAGISTSYIQLLTMRAVGGIGSAMFSVSAMTLLLRTVPATKRGRATGLYQGGFLIGGVAGPAIGGVFAAISLAAPFFFYAGTLAVAGLVGILLLKKDDGPRTREKRERGVTLGDVWYDRRFRAACLANLSQGWSALGVRSSLVPVLVVNVLLLDPSWTAVAFAIAAVVQVLTVGPAGSIVDKRGRKTPMIWASAVAAAAVMAIPFAPSLWVLIIILSVFGVTSAFLGTAPAASVGDAAGTNSGRAVAVFSMCSDIGSIAGPLIAGVLADALSYQAAFSVGALLFVVSALYSIRMPRTRIIDE